MFLITKWFGTFLCDDDGRPVEYKLFPKESEAIGKRLKLIDDGEILAEENKIIKSAAPESFSVFERRLEKLGGILTEERDVDLSEFEYDKELMHAAMIDLSKRKIRTEVRDDEHIVRAIAYLDEQTHMINVLTGRLKEWYALHFPELEKLVSRDRFVELVSEKTERRSMDLIEDSVGAEVTPSEIETFKLIGRSIREVDNSTAKLRVYIEGKMGEVAPNLNHIAGPLIGARLIAYAKGLERLARMPSGTVQLLGAEKSLFKHLRDGSKPPKHGIIFQHPMVHSAHSRLRGKIARAFASKISIAARADFYSKRFIAEELKEGLDRTVESIKNQQKV
jgi:nucleolar protein 56